MAIVKVHLPEDLSSFVDRQAAKHGYNSAVDYLSDLVRKQRDLEILLGQLLEGANSGPGREADEIWFAEMLKQVNR